MEFKDSYSYMTFLEDFINNKLGYDYGIICAPVMFTVESLQNKELSIKGTIFSSTTYDGWVVDILRDNLKLEGVEQEIFQRLVDGYYAESSHSRFELSVESDGTNYRNIKIKIDHCDTNEDFAKDIANSLTYDYLRDDDDPSYIKDKNEVLGVVNKITDFLTLYIRNACEDVSEKTYHYLQTLYK